MKRFQMLAAAAALATITSGAAAEPKYDPGASDSEIKLGTTVPLSGPASSYGIACAAHEAYFRMINETRGGVNGRKLKIECADDAFSPPKTVEQTRRLVEGDEVLAMYNSLGTAANSAVRRYLESKKTPQLLINSGASKWDDTSENPWVTSSLPHYVTEAAIFAKHVMQAQPDAKVGLLYQNDDYGRDYLNGLKAGFGDAFDRYVVATQTYDLTDPTVESQIANLRAADVDVVVLGALAKHAAQAIKRMGEMGWKPTTYLSWSSTGIDTVMLPAGAENSRGVISTAVIKHPDDPTWADDPAVKAYKDFVATYMPGQNASNISVVFAYATDEVLVDVLTRAGDDLTRENIRNKAQSIDVQPTMFIDGVRFATSPENTDPIHTFQLIEFDGSKWVLKGDPITAD